MEFTNHLGKIWEEGVVDSNNWRESIKNLLLLLAPIAPHVTEELWEHIGQPYSIHNQLLPLWDAELAQDEEITLVVQVNGKVRDKLQVSADITEEEAMVLALESKKVEPYLHGGSAPKVIYVPGRLVNLVIQ